MHRLLTILFSVSILLFVATVQAADAPAKKIKVLLISGDDVGAHQWREISETTREVLVSSGKFDVKVCEDMMILGSANALKNYDLVFLTRYNTTGTLSDQAKENLLDFVKSGKGFAISHLASASFPEWAEFKKLCGRNWVMRTSGHGPRGFFTAKVVNKESPISKALGDFETNDELYAKLQGDTPINVLLEADSDWSKKTEPLAFTVEYGNGRVFHETFGHDGAAILHPCVKKLIVRGCQWAASGKVD
jgi:type 1 glutamine amidotransferase